MDSLQDLTKPETKLGNKEVEDPKSQEDWRWQAWIDFRALNGTIIEFDEVLNTEKIRKMRIGELAQKLGVSRQTLYDWERNIPSFWDRVNQRTKELAGQRRISFMRDKFYLKAMKWEDRVISLAWMEQNDPNWRDPKQKIEHTLDDDATDLLRQIHAEKQTNTTTERTVIEGTVIDHAAERPPNA